MGQTDDATKVFIQNNDIFADVFNFFLYDGKQVIKPEDLQEVDITEIGIPYGKDGKSQKSVQKYRDVLKYASIKKDKNVVYCLMGVENQTSVHYAMPVRNAEYDVLQYAKQVENISKEHRKDKDFHSSAEYLSGFCKEDKLIPVITITILFSPKKWDGPTSIHEMFPDYPKEILRYVPDYRMNLIEPYNLTEEQLSQFQTNLGAVIEFIKYSQDKEETKKRILEDERFKHLDREAANVITKCTKFRFELEENKKGEVDMCKGLEDWLEEEKMEVQINNLKKLIKNVKLSPKDAMDVLEIPEDDRKFIMKELEKDLTVTK